MNAGRHQVPILPPCDIIKKDWWGRSHTDREIGIERVMREGEIDR